MNGVEPTKLLEGLFDKKKITLIKLFLDHPGQEYGVREAAKATRLAPATTHRILQKLLRMKIIEERKVKQLRLYKSTESKAARFLDELFAVKKSAIQEFVEGASQLPGVEEIIQHGKATKEKASLLVIGQELDTSGLSRLVGAVKERFKFTILHLTLSPEQYAQMSSMGLYAGEKQTLYRR